MHFGINVLVFHMPNIQSCKDGIPEWTSALGRGYHRTSSSIVLECQIVDSTLVAS